MSYAKTRNTIYNEIERDRILKISYMCNKCNFYVNEKCIEEKCINEIRKRRSYIYENSKNKVARVKRKQNFK